MIDVFGLNFPTEICVAIFGSLALDIFWADKAARLAGKVHGDIMQRSITLLKNIVEKKIKSRIYLSSQYALKGGKKSILAGYYTVCLRG